MNKVQDISSNSVPKEESLTSRWFFFVLVFMVFEYGRPQDLIPIGFLRPAMILQLILIWYLLSSRRWTDIKSRQTKYIFAFIILLGLFIPFARNTYWAYQTFKSMAMLMPFILSMMIVVNSVERLQKIINLLIVMMVYTCVYALLHGGRGIGNFAGDENDLALYINTVLPFCYFLMLYQRHNIKKFMYLTAMLMGILTIVLSRSRGGFVGLVCMIAVAWWYSPRKAVSLVVLCMLGIAGLYYGGESYRQEMATVTDTQENTAQGRLLHWETAWRMFLHNPWGVGGNNYPVRQQEYQAEGFTRVMWGRAAHSLWFTLLPEMGVAGIFIYFSLMVFNFKDLFLLRRDKVPDNEQTRYIHFISLAFLASFVGFFSSGTFLSVLYYPHFWYYTGILVATVKIAGRIGVIQK